MTANTHNPPCPTEPGIDTPSTPAPVSPPPPPANLFTESICGLANACATIGVMGEQMNQSMRCAAENPRRSDAHMQAAISHAKLASNHIALVHEALTNFQNEHASRIVTRGSQH